MRLNHILAVCLLTLLKIKGVSASHSTCELFPFEFEARTAHCRGNVTIRGCGGYCLSYQVNKLFNVSVPLFNTFSPTNSCVKPSKKKGARVGGRRGFQEVNTMMRFVSLIINGILPMTVFERLNFNESCLELPAWHLFNIILHFDRFFPSLINN